MRLGSAVLEVWERDQGLQYWRPGNETRVYSTGDLGMRPGNETRVCSTGDLGTRLGSAVLETWE